jgi:trimethylamine:corrinoid methyltransferase-like protein
MRPQVKLTYYIGHAGAPQAAFEAACIDAATQLCGGCFVAEGTGWLR